MERIDRSARVKITNDCQWSCEFCHNEGTEVPEDQQKRVSVFLDQDAHVLPPVESMSLDGETLTKLAALKELGIDEVHLTGGEPTLHPELPQIVSYFNSQGFAVKMTTNGQAQPNMTRRLAQVGVESMTFSILSFDPDEFLRTQRIKSKVWAEAMIRREKENILLAKSLGINVKINTVVLGQYDYPRVDTVLDFAREHQIKLVLLPSLGEGEEAERTVFDYALAQASYMGETHFSNNGKVSHHFTADDGLEIDAKSLRTYHPDVVCGGCEHNGQDSCMEHFYGLRLEFRGGEPYVRLCIQKTNGNTVMPLERFAQQDLIGKL